MSESANSEKMVEGTFSTYLGANWCPHVVQVALATDSVGTQGTMGTRLRREK